MLDAHCALGEGPLWSASEGVLYWLDIHRRRLHACRPVSSETRTIPLPATTGAAALCSDGRMLLATSRGIGRFDPVSRRFDPIPGTAPDWPSRYNDGGCDRAGRFWTGTTRLEGASGREQLHRLGTDGNLASIDGGFTICNGIGWSPDDKRLYFTDSSTRRIYLYDYELATGTVTNRRIFIEVPPETGVPDGLAVDAEGCIWVALWDGAAIARYDSAGKLERTVKLPLRRPTSCAFGGPRLETLFITSARRGLSRRALADAPLSGSLLAIEPGVRGLPKPAYAGF